MGLTQVTVTVRNPANLEAGWESLFLVDTGAIDCLIPIDKLAALGISPRTKRTYELADGTQSVYDVGIVEIEFMGEIVAANAIFGPEGAEPILGVTALESVGIAVDPRTQSLKRLPAVSLK